MKTLQERYGITGSVVSAVDLIHGLGRYAGMTNLEVEGVTGLFDTNYEGKAAAALESLETHDLAFVHIEGADEAGHEGTRAGGELSCRERPQRLEVARALDLDGEREQRVRARGLGRTADRARDLERLPRERLGAP